MKTTGKKPRSWILTVILSAAVLAYTFLIFVPMQRSIGKLRDELEQQRQYVIQGDCEFASYGQLEKELKQAHDYLGQWRETSSGGPDVDVLVGQISQIAAATGITIRRMSPSESVQLASVSRQSFQFDLEGSFSDLFEFLRQLEGLSGVIWSNQLHLEQREESGERLHCKLDLEVFTDNPDISD